MNNRIRAFRKSRKMTQGELGKLVNATVRQVGSWERGDANLTLEDACKIADVFHCTLDELAGRDFPNGGKEYSDARQTALNGHYGSLNDESKTDLVKFAKSFAADPERRVEKDGEEPAGNQAAMGA